MKGLDYEVVILALTGSALIGLVGGEYDPRLYLLTLPAASSFIVLVLWAWYETITGIVFGVKT